MKSERGDLRDHESVRIHMGDRREDGTYRILRLEGRTSRGVIDGATSRRMEKFESAQNGGGATSDASMHRLSPDSFYQPVEANLTGGIIFNGLSEGGLKA